MRLAFVDVTRHNEIIADLRVLSIAFFIILSVSCKSVGIGTSRSQTAIKIFHVANLISPMPKSPSSLKQVARQWTVLVSLCYGNRKDRKDLLKRDMKAMLYNKIIKVESARENLFLFAENINFHISAEWQKNFKFARTKKFDFRHCHSLA